MRVHTGGHALHADRAVDHARLAALASVRALMPTQPSSGRCTMATPPLEDSVRDGALATAGAPSTGGVAISCRAARAPRRSRQQHGGQRAPAPREGKRSTTKYQIARLRFTEPFSGLTSYFKKKGQSANRE